ncbi:MAG: hypothetical protein F6K09_24585 [Merismopedia sp. SIO2A8]|nr:hypothetical protein [Merismopedia sp. SIO2A8]
MQWLSNVSTELPPSEISISNPDPNSSASPSNPTPESNSAPDTNLTPDTNPTPESNPTPDNSSTGDSQPTTSPSIPPVTDPNPEVTAPTDNLLLPQVSVSDSNTRFSSLDEATLQGLGGASITVGSQRIYTGYRQVSGNNQDPIIVSFDDTNPENNWVGTTYDTSGADSRGYGLFWSGSDLYAVFSIDGAQAGDFRPASRDAITPWLRSYGNGGGAKVAVIGRINRATGELVDAAYLSAVLTNGRTNSLIVEDVSTNANGNILVRSRTASYPRDVNGNPITNVTGPFDYTVELTPDLKRVISTNVA